MNPEDVIEIVQDPVSLAPELPSRRTPPRTGNQRFKGNVYKAPKIKKFDEKAALLFAHRLRYELQMPKNKAVASIAKQTECSVSVARSLYEQVGKKRKRH